MPAIEMWLIQDAKGIRNTKPMFDKLNIEEMPTYCKRIFISEELFTEYRLTEALYSDMQQTLERYMN